MLADMAGPKAEKPKYVQPPLTHRDSCELERAGVFEEALPNGSTLRVEDRGYNANLRTSPSSDCALARIRRQYSRWTAGAGTESCGQCGRDIFFR